VGIPQLGELIRSEDDQLFDYNSRLYLEVYVKIMPDNQRHPALNHLPFSETFGIKEKLRFFASDINVVISA